MSSPVGGFFPIPLAMMIPFMATQSLVMGDAFGRSFQYGKRKISAMSNEEFNALTTEIIAEQIYKEYKNIIPNLKQSLVDSQELQNKIIDELLALPSNALANLFRKISGGVEPSEEQTYIDPNDPNKDFAPPTGGPPAGGRAPSPSPPSRRTPTVLTAETVSENSVNKKLQSAQSFEKQLLAYVNLHEEAIQRYQTQRRSPNPNNSARPAWQAKTNALLIKANQMSAVKAQMKVKLQALYTTYNKAQEAHKTKYGKYVQA